MVRFTCRCGENRPEEFYLRPSGNPRGECKTCEKKRATLWIDRNRKRHNQNIRKAAIKRGAHWPEKLRRHGLTKDDYDISLAQQNNRCSVCDSTDPGRGRKHFCIDHDHRHCPGAYGCPVCFRGLLCNRCNRLLGMASDDPDILASAAAYLAAVR